MSYRELLQCNEDYDDIIAQFVKDDIDKANKYKGTINPNMKFADITNAERILDRTYKVPDMIIKIENSFIALEQCYVILKK